MKIAVCDDEVEFLNSACSMILKWAEKNDIHVKLYRFDNGDDLLKAFHKCAADMIILDIMMPDVDGFSYCDKIRSLVDCPILFLTAKTMEHDITFGLGLGADDYLTKPFRIAELRARVNAHLRRERRERHTALTFDRIKIDLFAKELRVDNTPVALTKSEYLICEYLARNKGQVFSKEQIYEAVFSLEGDSDNSTISTHIKNIRSKLNKLDIQPIATVWGIGYKWE